ncbi:hypothetical protein STEG23_017826, partial [Scotinomys teguina]
SSACYFIVDLCRSFHQLLNEDSMMKVRILTNLITWICQFRNMSRADSMLATMIPLETFFVKGEKSGQVAIDDIAHKTIHAKEYIIISLNVTLNEYICGLDQHLITLYPMCVSLTEFSEGLRGLGEQLLMNIVNFFSMSFCIIELNADERFCDSPDSSLPCPMRFNTFNFYILYLTK